MVSNENGRDQIVTTDLSLTAFYLLNGLELLGVVRHPDARTNNDCSFRLRDTGHRSAELRLKWASSAEQRFDSQVRSLRKLIVEARKERSR